MRERDVPMADSQYRSLKSYVAKRGGFRLGMHGTMRDRLVETIVEEWPETCHPDRIEEVVRARVGLTIRKRYGSILAMFLIGVLVNAIVRLVLEWWLARDAHRVLMAGWSRNAQQNPNL